MNKLSMRTDYISIDPAHKFGCINDYYDDVKEGKKYDIVLVYVSNVDMDYYYILLDIYFRADDAWEYRFYATNKKYKFFRFAEEPDFDNLSSTIVKELI